MRSPNLDFFLIRKGGTNWEDGAPEQQKTKSVILLFPVAVNLGVGLAREGKKVCLLDADPQGNLTISLGYSDPDEIPITGGYQLQALRNHLWVIDGIVKQAA